MPFWIVSDACCDLPYDYIQQQQQLKLLPMAYQIDGKEQLYDLTRADCAQTAHAIYDRLLDGASSTTAQINEQTWIDELEPIVKQGDDLLALVFSSALSLATLRLWSRSICCFMLDMLLLSGPMR